MPVSKLALVLGSRVPVVSRLLIVIIVQEFEVLKESLAQVVIQAQWHHVLLRHPKQSRLCLRGRQALDFDSGQLKHQVFQAEVPKVTSAVVVI